MHSESKKNIIWTGAGILLIVTVGIISASVFGNPSSEENLALLSITAPPITEGDWILGNQNATVTLIEYGDFQCPACAHYHPIVKRIIAEYGDRIQFAFRNFPLTEIHDNAMLAAQAAEAAGAQDRYWSMHDLLFETQKEWGLLPFGIGVENHFINLIKEGGGNETAFKEALHSEAIKNKVESDRNAAILIQVKNTPTFFVNLKRIKNPKSYEEFKAEIEKALATE